MRALSKASSFASTVLFIIVLQGVHFLMLWSDFLKRVLYLFFIVGTACLVFSLDTDVFKFNVEPKNQIALRDESLLFNCAAKFGDIVPSISWLRDGLELTGEDDGRRVVLSNGSLQFSSVVHTRSHRPDEGVYQCKATLPDTGTIVSRKATLQVTCKFKYNRSCNL